MSSEESDVTTTLIEPDRSRLDLNVRELWAYRELLYFLTWRDVKIRYKQTLIGVAWAILQPVVTTAIFTLLFSTWAKFETGDIPYPLFVLSALSLWLFTHSSITIASNSFINNTNLVTKVYFPRLIVPVAATLAGIFDLLISLGLLAILFIYYGISPTIQLMAAPVFVMLAFLQAAAFGTLLSALTVKYRDVKFALPFALQVWMIASPIFYPASMLPEKWRLVFALNPLIGIIDGFRSALFGLPFNLEMIGISCLSIIGISLLSLFIFKGMEDGFADVI